MMKRFSILLVCLCCIAACSKRGIRSMGDGADVQANGIGGYRQFDEQETGESYTSKAPHSQTYLFDFDNSQLAHKYQSSLQAQAHYLSSHPRARILLAGHTDERGSREYNVALGERRANAVQWQLLAAGVKKTQIRVVSYGKERSAADGHDERSHRQNRRVELIYEVT